MGQSFLEKGLDGRTIFSCHFLQEPTLELPSNQCRSGKRVLARRGQALEKA